MNNSTNLTNTLIILTIVLLLYSVFFTRSINTNIKEYNKKINQIQLQIDSIQKVNTLIDDRVLEMKDQFTLLNKDITKVKTNINIIRNSTNEKINSIDNYTIHELTKYFSDRYSSDTTGTSSKNGNKRSNKR